MKNKKKQVKVRKKESENKYKIQRLIKLLKKWKGIGDIKWWS